jgi:molybdopterin-containing oxidoreductase family iron-sulfur binding subunit
MGDSNNSNAQPGVPESSSVDPLDAAADEYDQELGRQMGQDARRVANGEMTEAAFYEKYHDAVVEQFGEDRRPVAVTEDDE